MNRRARRPDHDQHTQHADGDRQPAPPTDPFAEKRSRQRGDEQGGDEKKGHGLGQWHGRECHEIGAIADDDEAATQKMQAQAPRLQNRQTALEMGEEEGQQETKTTADQHRLVQGVGAADPFDDGVLKRKGHHAGDREKDGADRLAVILCLHGDHWACSRSVVAPDDMDHSWPLCHPIRDI